MGLDVLKIILFRGIREDFLGMLNLLEKRDISKESFENIVELCRRCSRGSSRTKNVINWNDMSSTEHISHPMEEPPKQK